MLKNKKMISLALSGSLLTPMAASATVGVLGLGALASQFNISSAADSDGVTENFKATTELSEGTVLNYSSFYNILNEWDVSKDAKAGDTTIFTLPDRVHFYMGDSVIKDADGNKIADIKVDEYSKITVTYTDYVEKYKNVHVSINMPILTESELSTDGNDIKVPISITVDGVKKDLNKTFILSGGSLTPNSGALESPAMSDHGEIDYNDYQLLTKTIITNNKNNTLNNNTQVKTCYNNNK